MEHAPGQMIVSALWCHPMVQWKLSTQGNEQPHKSLCEDWTQDLHVLSIHTYYSVICELPVCGTGKAAYQTVLINPSTCLDLELN